MFWCFYRDLPILTLQQRQKEQPCAMGLTAGFQHILFVKLTGGFFFASPGVLATYLTCIQLQAPRILQLFPT